MSSTTITLPPYRAETRITADGDRIAVDAHRALLQLYNASPLIKVSTIAGPANFPLPFAKNNQDVEITYVKTSADANVPTIVATGTDLINGAASIAMNTAQYSKLRLRSDGVSSWYVVG